MTKSWLLLLGALAMLAGVILWVGTAASGRAVDAGDTPHYTADGQLLFPANYREWVFLTSSIDMSYSDRPVHQFDNVFVPRAAYRAFLKNGVWPDQTVLILENRGVSSNGSITRSGQFQTGAVTGLEAHVKDAARFEGGWGFFGFNDARQPADLFSYDAACYSCHRQHAAADTTFVQFYPTLLPVATRLGALNPLYVKATSK